MGSQHINILNLTVRSTTALIQKRFVNFAGAYATAAGNTMGVAKYDAEGAGEDISVTVLGTAIVEAGGAIAVGAAVEVGTTGKAVTNSAGTIVGRALEAAAADGDQIEILLVSH